MHERAYGRAARGAVGSWKATVARAVTTVPHSLESAVELTLTEVAELLKVSRKTIYRWIRERRIPFYRISRQFRFNPGEIEAWISRSRREAAGVAGADVESVPALHELLRRGGIHFKVEGATLDEAIAGALEVLTIPQSIRSEAYLAAVLARERMASTAIGGGVAVPHPRSPFPVAPEQQSLSLCFLEEPVDFRAPDGEPVRTLFFPFPDGLAAHLEILSRIGRLCRERRFLDLLAGRAGRRDIMEYVEGFDRRVPT